MLQLVMNYHPLSHESGVCREVDGYELTSGSIGYLGENKFNKHETENGSNLLMTYPDNNWDAGDNDDEYCNLERQNAGFWDEYGNPVDQYGNPINYNQNCQQDSSDDDEYPEEYDDNYYCQHENPDDDWDEENRSENGSYCDDGRTYNSCPSEDESDWEKYNNDDDYCDY